jgi:quinol-cytochrome oxidoreductase complex cytochrome b subunit
MSDMIDTEPTRVPTSSVDPVDSARPAPGDERMWTARVRGAAVRALPPGKLLPDRQPSYVASWVYVFGILSFSAFVVILVTGVVLILRGPSWWHESSTGLFFNSIHLWSVELFFFFMVLHLWGKFFMAAWRGKRALTWMTGVVTFAVSIGAAFTGYLSQQNFDSQWISTQAKDGLNAAGVGAFFNVLNFGQMLLWHVLLLPIAVGVLIGIHLLLVRRRGVVRPFPVPVGRHTSTDRAAARGEALSTEGADR